MQKSPQLFSRRSLLTMAGLGLGAGLVGCGRQSSEPSEPAEPEPETPIESVEEEPKDPVREIMPTSLEEKVASCLHVGVSSFEEAHAALALGVGGIFITSWADPLILTEPGRNLHALKEEFDRPFGVSIDFEGGRVQRHSEILGDFPAPGHMGETMTPEQVTGVAYDIGTRLREHGININFAPVVDVDGADLEVVGDRSFSTDPHTAGTYGAAFAQGVENAAVRAVYKHFPGHGRASGDTHEEEVTTPPLDHLQQHDLHAFTTAFELYPAAVMMGHLTVPGLSDTPTSLSPEAYYLLRTPPFAVDEVVYTDDLTGMAAITNHYSLEEAVVAALGAGADQALWSTGGNVQAAIDAVIRAIEREEIELTRIDNACYRMHRSLMAQP